MRVIIVLILAFSSKMAFALLPVYLYENYKPFSYGNTDSPKGLYVTLVTQVLNHAKVNYELHILPFNSGLNRAMQGDGMIAGLLKTAERTEKMQYSQAFYTERTLMYVKKGHAFPLDTMQDLKGKVIGVNLGWSYGKEFNDAKKQGVFGVDVSNNDFVHFKKLLADRVDAYVVNDLAARYEIAQMGIDDQVEALSKVIDSGDIYVAIGKQNSQVSVIAQFDQALKELNSAGKIDALITEFIQKHYNQ